MADKELILDRYEVLGVAGSGGFGTVRIAWDPRIQRKVAIKTIELTERDALRAALPGAEAVAKPAAVPPTARAAGAGTTTARTPQQARTARLEAGEEEYDYPFAFGNLSEGAGDGGSAPTAALGTEWRGVTPWREFIAQEDAREGRAPLELPEVVADPALFDEPDDEGEPWADDGQPGGTLRLDGPYGEGVLQLEPIGAPAAEMEQVTALAHVPGLDEARTAAKLSDSRIVTVYDFEVRERTAYLIMEYIEGITLSTLLDDYDEFLNLDMVAQLFDAVAGALTVAHKAGVLHLDIKPDNIIINRDGQAKVTDFGLATLADASGAGTTGGGTIGYMPLEQMRREHLDARTDEWALASVAYEMLTGENPFFAPTLSQAEQVILNAELVLPSLCWGSLDSQVDDVIFYALDPDREERYANVSDFAEEMDKFLGDPEKGKGELALVVAEALREAPAEPEPYAAPAAAEEPRKGGFLSWLPLAKSQIGSERGEDPLEPALPEPLADAPVRPAVAAGHTQMMRPAPEAPRRQRLQEKLGAYLEEYEAEEAREEFWPVEEPEPQELVERIPLAGRIPQRAAAVAARALGACGCGFVGALGVGNIPLVATLAGDAAPVAMAVGAAALAGLSLFRLPAAALTSFCLLAVALTWCGHPVVGAVLALAAGLWFYITGREGAANANTVLLEPLAGSIGMGAVVPFAAGLSLRPVQAGVSALFAFITACVLGSLGSSSLLGWDAAAFWQFADADITRSFARIITRPLTWTMLAGWVGAAVALSVLSLGRHRWGLLAGLAVAVAAMLAGTLVFTAPTPQLFLSLIAAVAASLVLFL